MLCEIQEYFSKCPYLEGKTVNLNYLGSDVCDCTLMYGKDDEVLKVYADGGRLVATNPVFLIRSSHLRPLSSNIENDMLCENICAWLREQSKNNFLPDLGEKGKAVSIEVTGYGIEDTGHADITFYISLRLSYITN